MKTVNQCKEEYTPYLSMRRAFDHQQHKQGLFCVVGFLAVPEENRLYEYPGPHIESQSLDKMHKQVRIIYSSDACDAYKKNTKVDENGKAYKDDEWIKSEEQEVADPPAKEEPVTVTEVKKPTDESIPPPPPPPPAF